MKRNGIFRKAPTTARQLARVVRELFDISVPDRAVCPGHDAPFEYLLGSFFRQEDLLVWACRGGGKTYLAAAATLLDAIFHGPLKILVLGGSFDQSDRLADYIRDILLGHTELISGRVSRQRVRLVPGSEIRMLPQSQQAVRGQHVQRIRCDEVDLFDEEVWRAVQFSTRSRKDTRGSIEVLSTLHRPGGLMQRLVNEAHVADLEKGQLRESPPRPGYRLIRWCLWEVIEHCDDGRRCEECLLADDCRGVARQANGFFPIDDAISIKARSSRAAWETEMLCLGAQRDNLVFREFSTSRHVRKVEYCRDWPLYRAIDFGYRSPLVCLWLQLTPAGCVHVIDEYVQAFLPVATHAREILKRDPRQGGRAARVEMTYVDPAGRQRESTSGRACTEILAAAGIPCAWRASSVGDGLELVRSALAPAAGEPTLLISPRCAKLIEAFNSYHYPPAGAPGNPDSPVKDGPDHVMDALRYFFVNRFRPRQQTQRTRY
ncbi:MAG: hypothetical protein ACYTF6_05495 [Planctomycetota bacterium]|jgi:hypothetical protein